MYTFEAIDISHNSISAQYICMYTYICMYRSKKYLLRQFMLISVLRKFHGQHNLHGPKASYEEKQLLRKTLRERRLALLNPNAVGGPWLRIPPVEL